jgi:hypothetical protein
MLGSKGGEGAANWGEGAANSPNPGGGGRTDGGWGARRAVLTMERDGRRRPARYGKRKPLGSRRERLSANCASMRCSSQSCVTESSV